MYYLFLGLLKIVNSKKSDLSIKKLCHLCTEFFEIQLDFLYILYILKKQTLKQKEMVINLIYSVLLLIAGSVVAAAILLFGVKFSNNSGELSTDPTWKDIFLQMIKGYPFWVWTFAFLAFQPAILHIITTWFPMIWTTYDWIPSISDFIAFIAVGFFTIIVRITDDNGKLKNFLKKSEWSP